MALRTPPRVFWSGPPRWVRFPLNPMPGGSPGLTWTDRGSFCLQEDFIRRTMNTRRLGVNCMPGCHRRSVERQSPFNTWTRIWNRRWAPASVHRIWPKVLLAAKTYADGPLNPTLSGGFCTSEGPKGRLRENLSYKSVLITPFGSSWNWRKENRQDRKSL
jgi:hypothetical protein